MTSEVPDDGRERPQGQTVLPGGDLRPGRDGTPTHAGMPPNHQTDYDHDREREREARKLAMAGQFSQARQQAELIHGRKQQLHLLDWIDQLERDANQAGSPQTRRSRG